MLTLDPTHATAVRAPMSAGQLVHARLEPASPTTGRAPILPGQLLDARLAPTLHRTDRAPTSPDQLLDARLAPTLHTTDRAPISPDQLLDPRLEPGFSTTGSAPLSPDQLLNARPGPDALRLTVRQPMATIPSVSCWSMRSWESVRQNRSRRRGVPRSHGPAAAEIAEQRLRFGQQLGAWFPVGAPPRGWRSARPQPGRTGPPWGKPWHDDAWAAEVAALVTGPPRAPAGPTGSGETP
jgi:hypothetical protein